MAQSYYFFVSWTLLSFLILNIFVALDLIKLNAIDSTNSYLKKLVKETALQDQTVVIAENQISGRGQMGNGWVSQKGQSLTFSAFKQYDGLLTSRQFMIAMAISSGIFEVLQGLDVPTISIKWPNDIMSAQKKVGGILIENVLEGNTIKYSVIGIGLNVNETTFLGLPRASSLKLETGINFNLEKVLQLILKNIFRKLKNLSQKDFSEIKKDYEKNLFRREMISVFENTDGLRFNGIIKGVSEIGELMVETENAALQKFQLKEVKLIY